MRTMWNGVITFGLVSIPVGMYPATKDNQVSFHLLHKKDCGRIKNQRVCTKCGEVLDYDELIKGYEYEKGQYVEMSQEELNNAKAAGTESIEIIGFVDLEEIDPIYFDAPYILTSGKRGEKPYALLRDTMRATGKAGIAKFVLRTKEYLAAVRVRDNALILNTMHFAEDIREVEGVPEESVAASKAELDMARQLVSAMGTEFDATQYKNTYNEKLLSIIEKKLEGKPVAAKTTTKAATGVLDLMERLKASLSEAETEVAKKPARKGAVKAKAPVKKQTPQKTKLRMVA